MGASASYSGGNSEQKGSTAMQQFYAHMSKRLDLPLAAVNNLPSVSAPSGPAIKDLDAKIAVHYAVHGGASALGTNELAEYADSVYSKGKEQLIRDIASDVFSVMGIAKGPEYAKTQSIKNVVAQLSKLVPNPATGRRFPSSSNTAENHKKMCRAVGVALNKHYHSGIINLDADPKVLCDKVAEVLYTLFRGVSGEFLRVSGDLSRILRNLQLLGEFANGAYKRQLQIIKSTGDPGAKMQSDSVSNFYNRIEEERKRQMVLITNALSTSTSPLGKSLITLLEDNKDLVGLVKDLRGELGTQAFGDKIGYMLKGVSTVASSVNLVDKALKVIGMSLDEYKNTKSLSDLRSKIYDHMSKNNPNSLELQKMADAANILFTNDLAHADIIAYMKKNPARGKSGGAVKVKLTSSDDETLNYWSKKSLTRQLKKQDTTRKLLLKEFDNRVKVLYAKIIQSVRGIAPNIGKSIPITDNLDIFIKLFSNMPEVNEENLYLSLSGYQKDSGSQQRRHQFLENLRVLSAAAGKLSGGKSGEHFSKLQTAISDLVGVIDQFSTKFLKALTELTINSPENIRKELKGYYGSAEYDTSREIITMGRIKAELTHYWKIATMRQDLARSASELQTYGAEYENILGDEAGWVINAIRKKYNDSIVAVADTDADAVKEKKETVNEIHRINRDAKVGIVEAAQAIDLYMKAFADGIAMNPNDIKSLASSLEQLDIVFRWFNDKSGNHFASLFESFSDEAKKTTNGIRDGVYTPVTTKHYYDEFKNNLPGDRKGFDVKTRKHLKEYYALSEKVVKSMRALENVLNIFDKLGRKFGNIDPKAKTFMTAGQIFNALCDYVTASAFALETAGQKLIIAKLPTGKYTTAYNNAGTPDPNEPDQFELVDSLFIMSIKAIACKVMTCVDVWRMYNRPVDEESKASLSATRMILGGANVKVIDEAMELYVRLPLLAEWYRDKFNFKKSETKGDERIVSMVPSVDGIWSNFITLIFSTTDYIENGTYTEQQVNSIIKEINTIYTAYKSRNDNAVRYTVNALITEMNRRFGFLKKAEINAYIDSKRGPYNSDTKLGKTSADDRVDYDLLNADDQFGRGVAPSDKFITVDELKLKTRKNTRVNELHDAILKFRESMDEDFNSVDNKSSFSFVDTIRQHKKELSLANDNESRYLIAKKAIQGVNRFSNISQEKVVIIHEYVTLPLALLTKTYDTLANYNYGIHGMLVADKSEGKAPVLPGQPSQPALSDEKLAETREEIKILETAKKAKENERESLSDADKEKKINADIASIDADISKLVETIVVGKGEYSGGAVDMSAVDAYLRARMPDNPTWHKQKLVNSSKTPLSKKDQCEKIIKSILSLCGSLGKEVLVNVTPEGKIMVDWSGLQSTCVSMLIKIKKNIDLFRANFISGDTITKYEDNNKVGSIYWLEDRMVNVLFNNRDKFGLPQTNESINMLWKGITDANVDGREIFEKLVFAVNATDSSPIDAAGWPRNIIKQSDKDGQTVNASHHVTELYKSDWKLGSHSLFSKFNEITAKYVQQSFDSATGKYFVPMIEEFANGVASNYVMGGNGYPDITEGKSNIGVYGNARPAINQGLYASTSAVMREILTRMDLTLKKLKYPMESFEQMPMHIKERLRANLPIYSKLLQQLCYNSTIILKFLKNGGLVLSDKKYNDVTVANIPNVSSALVDTGDQDKTQQSQWYEGFIAHLCEMCRSLDRSVTKTQKLLSDAPVFGEVFKGSVESYRSQYQTPPLTPLSTVMAGFKKAPDALFPQADNGSSGFKLRYTTRGLLARWDLNVNFDNVPGMKDIVSKYNAISSRDTSMELSTALSLTSEMACMARFLLDKEFYREKLFSYDPISKNESEPADGAESILKLYSTTHDVFSTMSVIESGSPITNREKLAAINSVDGSTAIKDSDRKELRIYNILDMNIVPINVHAFIRETPWINLLNYSYTYDCLVKELLVGKNNRHAIDNPTDTQTLLAKSLISPWASQSKDTFKTLYARMVNGDSILGGRPKYLSDQLWNKVLLGSTYGMDNANGINSTDEAGPRVFESQLRIPNVTRGKLKYLQDGKIVSTSIESGDVESTGHKRHETRIVRNMEWFINIQRMLRLLMRERLRGSNNVVASAHKMLNNNFTEFRGNDKYSPKQFTNLGNMMIVPEN